MVRGKDLGVLRVKTTAKLPHLKLCSRERPEIKLGDPTFLVSPLEVIGAANATMGVQYLAKGFFRFTRRHSTHGS